MITPSANSADHPQGSSPSEEEFVRLFMQFQRILLAYLRTTLVVPWTWRRFSKKPASFCGATVKNSRRVPISWIGQPRLLKMKFTSSVATINTFHKSSSEELLDQWRREWSRKVIWSRLGIGRFEQCLQDIERTRSAISQCRLRCQSHQKGSGTKVWECRQTVIYKALNRIRQRLLKCIRHRLIAEGRV